MNIDIKIPYTTRPSMTRRTGPAFKTPTDLQKIQLKNYELNRHADMLWGTIEGAEPLIRRAARHCGKPETDSIVELALCFQEDFAIMHRGHLTAVCFCFPSGWVPKNKVGLSLAEIHQPVADGQDLVRMSNRLAHTMADVSLGGFERSVWTVTASPYLNGMPGAYNLAEPNNMSDLYFRWEEQTTEPLSDGASSLFFVDVHVVPLLSIWNQLGSKISQSINSMSEAVLAYKNLVKIKTILNSS